MSNYLNTTIAAAVCFHGSAALRLQPGPVYTQHTDPGTSASLAETIPSPPVLFPGLYGPPGHGPDMGRFLEDQSNAPAPETAVVPPSQSQSQSSDEVQIVMPANAPAQNVAPLECFRPDPRPVATSVGSKACKCFNSACSAMYESCVAPPSYFMFTIIIVLVIVVFRGNLEYGIHHHEYLHHSNAEFARQLKELLPAAFPGALEFLRDLNNTNASVLFKDTHHWEDCFLSNFLNFHYWMK